MKLLRLIGGLNPEHGGPPVSSVNACIAAQRAGAETTFAFPIEGEPHGVLADTLARLREEGVEVRYFPYSSQWGKRGKSWGVSRQLAHWINNNYLNFDIVHCHGAWQMATFLMARRSGTGPALVLTPHESMTNFDIAQSSSMLTGMAKKWLRHYYAKKFDLIVLSSSLEANDSAVGDTGDVHRAVEAQQLLGRRHVQRRVESQPLELVRVPQQGPRPVADQAADNTDGGNHSDQAPVQLQIFCFEHIDVLHKACG